MPKICFCFVPWNHFFREQVRIHLTCPPNHFEPKKTKCEFWVVFRSERPVLPIFSPCIMSNENYERKKITIPSLQDVFIEYPQRLSSFSSLPQFARQSPNTVWSTAVEKSGAPSGDLRALPSTPNTTRPASSIQLFRELSEAENSFAGLCYNSRFFCF